MIIEMRTYTVQPGSVATVEERFGQALPARAKLSPLAAFWHTEVGPLNRVIPPNFQMPPHTHPYSEVVTLISGPVGTSHGEKFEKNGEMLKPGSLWVYPARHAHYAWTGNEEAIIQVQFTGPGGIDYINPEDDPRKK